MTIKRIIAVLMALMFVSVCAVQCFAADEKAKAATEITDNLVGKNTPGPYTLTWKDFDEKSLSVVVNGRTLKKNKDYKVSVSDGMLSFTSVLVTDAIARVKYTLIANTSAKTTTASATPLSLSLLNSGNNKFAMTGLYAKDANGNTTAVAGVSGEKKWGGGNFLKSAFNMSQGDGDTMDRSSMQLGMGTHLGKLQISGNYSNVGNAFAGASNLGQTLGEKISELNMAFTPEGGKLQATSTYKETEYTTGDKKGFYSLESKQNASFAAGSSTKLGFERTETANQAKEGAVRTSEEKSVATLQQALGKFGNANMSMTDSVTVDKDNKKTEIQSKDYNLATGLLGFGNAKVNVIDRQTTVNGVLTDLQQKDYSLAKDFSGNLKTAFNMTDKQTTVNGVLTDTQQSTYALSKAFSDKFGATFNMTDTQSTVGGVRHDNKTQISTLTGNLGGAAMKLTSTDIEKIDDGTIDNIKKNVLDMSKAINSKTNFAASLARQTSDSRGKDNSSVYALTSKLRDNLAVSLGRTMLESDIDGDTETSVMKLDTFKFKNMEFTGGLTSTDNTLKGKTDSSEMNLKMSPIKNMSFSTNYKSVESDADGLTDTTAMTLGFKPKETFEVSGTVSDKTTKDVPTLSRTLNVKSTALKYTTLSGLMGQSGTGDAITDKQGLSIAFAPKEKTAFSAGFVDEVTGNSSLLTTNYAAQFALAKFLTFSGTMTDREGENMTTAVYDTTNANATLNLGKHLAVTGSYNANPLDKKGVMENYEARTLGITTKFGSLAFTTAYTSKDQYLANNFVDETKFGLSLPLFGSGTLETGFKTGRSRTSVYDLNRQYSLAYKAKFSDDFSLSLGGTYTRYIQNQMRMPDKDNLEADLTLELKF
ncbi:MAG: hypothetical protein J6332_04635 [Abditibacteriota bacterium]|nr:hypothetical protein [Abditibacteriota bacterium]